MDSDESRDSFGSDSECENKGPASPGSQSPESVRSKSPSGQWDSPQRGPRSPDTYGPRSPSPEQFGPCSPSPEGSVPDSPRQIASPVGSVKSSVHSDDNSIEMPMSPKSSSSQSSGKSSHKSSFSPKSPDNSPRNSVKSVERRGPKSPPLGNSSDSSDSSDDSGRNKSKERIDAQAEEISDGEMEYDGGKESDDEAKPKLIDNGNVNLSHEDLSDVSDLDSLGAQSEEELLKEDLPKPPTDLRQKLDEAKNRKLNEKQNNPPEKTSKTEDGEEQLDFEAEDGECVEETKPKVEEVEQEEAATPAEAEEVEEGEVTDDDEVRPEETEPRPVCRFYSRGQCTWGASCRFLHPGVTDKGNYTMFELIRPLVPGPGFGVPDFRDERSYGVPPARGEAPMVESAWERGLRTAKEMMRKAIKRKEQDMDFEEKKMNLSLAQEELDKENGYYTRSASPPPVEALPRHYVPIRHPTEYRQARLSDEYYGRRVLYEPEPRGLRLDTEYEGPRERVRSYRELPTHRMPDYYNDKYEEPAVSASGKSRKPKREVIVQRVDSGRGDEWADPWMRSKSPGSRGKPGRYSSRRQSYSSASSYSSSSSSRSSSTKSSYRGDSRSRSHSPASRSRRRPKSPPVRHRVPGGTHRAVSPSVIVSEKKAANERALLMNPPAPSPKKAHKDNRPPSPGMMRTSAQNPPAPPPKTLATDQYGRTKDRSKHEADRKKLAVAAALASKLNRARASRSSSGSDSSGSSSSDSESSYSSSSSSRDGTPVPRRKVPEKVELAAIALKAKAMDALKTGDKRQIKLNLKTVPKKPGIADLADLRKEKELLQGKKRSATSPPAGDMTAPKLAAIAKAANNKKSTSRREELLKQLKAVEDAIAKKRSKIN